MIEEEKKAAEETGVSGEEMEKLSKKIDNAEKNVKGYQYFILRLGVFLLLMWLLFFVFIGITHMPSTDMYPRVDAGDFVLFYRLDKDVRAQDIIVIEKEVPGMKGKQVFISRVVAVAGDTVEIDEERLIINGNTVVETNIFYPTLRYEGYTEYPLTLKEGECFVLGDARNNATDSRFFGPVLQDEIGGTVITIVRRNNL
ncbi:MAG: signal peptidase I [Lachnospiraceae bacterium]|nr:signal peptidase I [Lachnospiraceae bacterium]